MKGPRFSIVTLLLSTALFGFALALVSQSYEIWRVHTRHKQLILETGYLDVRDPSKVYLRELSCPAPQTWRFQIYLPPEHSLESGMGVELNDDGWPSRLLDTGPLSRHGQYTLTVSLHQLHGLWRLSKFHGDGGSDYRLVAADFAWLQQQEHQRGYSNRAEDPVHGAVREFEPDAQIVLLKLQNQSSDSADDGSLMIWFEPKLREHYREPTEADSPTEHDLKRRTERQNYLIRQQVVTDQVER